ncbi:rhodanese-like domain-containing protein [Curtobacterium sp. MCBD17_040]|uniref:rhodanese-like domain-containing protein n=1 Tax=Curtobacterium sp. MCBD17_040 TaxID=2175674 RepID=UPI000DA9EA6F|nr:rhodanese-like domain-containing protein [Curtobacterium sp. MCBD17_040]WIB62186.1 rhodanese-like domain-containing protein [Curtobacterium sp. MCBD17_040]
MQEIDVHEAMRRVEGGARLIDVREQDEWDAGHAPVARLLPMSALQERWTEIATDDEPALIICHSGHRSRMVADALERSGVPAVSVAGGMVAWAQAGGAVTTAADDASGHHDAVGEPGSDA